MSDREPSLAQCICKQPSKGMIGWSITPGCPVHDSTSSAREERICTCAVDSRGRCPLHPNSLQAAIEKQVRDPASSPSCSYEVWWLCAGCLNAFEEDPGPKHWADDEGQITNCGTQPIAVTPRGALEEAEREKTQRGELNRTLFDKLKAALARAEEAERERDAALDSGASVWANNHEEPPAPGRDEHDPVDWDAVAAYAAQLEAAGPLVRQAEEAQRERWNSLLFKLARLAKPDNGYEGETSDELIELLAQRIRY